MLSELPSVAQAERSVESFRPSSYFEDLTQIRERAEKDADAFHAYVEQADWTGLISEAEQMMDTGTRRIHRLLGGQQRLAEAAGAAGTIHEHLAAYDEGPGSPERKEVVSYWRRLNDRAPARLMPEDVLEQVEQGKESLQRVETAMSLGVRGRKAMLRRQRDLAIWYAVAGYLTRGEAAVYREVDGAKPIQHSPEVQERVESDLETIQADAMDRFRDLFTAVVSEEWGTLDARALQAASLARTALPELEASAKLLREGRLYEDRVDGDAGQEAAFARGEVDLHRTLQTLGLLLGVGHWLRFLARRPDSDAARDAAEDASEKGFVSLVRDGVNVDLGDLVDDAESYDGRLVEVEGFVDNLRYDPEGSATRFDLVDRLHDVRVPVFYPFHDLTSWHLRQGAFLHGHAHFEADSEWADGPELQIDEVEVGRNSDESWFDHIVHEFASLEILDFHPSRANVLWSFELPAPHRGDRG